MVKGLVMGVEQLSYMLGPWGPWGPYKVSKHQYSSKKAPKVMHDIFKHVANHKPYVTLYYMIPLLYKLYHSDMMV